MKTILLLKYTLAFIILVSFLSACNNDDSPYVNYIAINNDKYELTTGNIKNLSWPDDEMGTFEIKLTNNSTFAFSFRLISPEIEILSEGTYNYSWFPNNSFLVVLPLVKMNNEIVFPEKDYSWNGSITIKGTEPNFNLNINLKAVDDITNESIIIKGNFSETFSAN